MNKSAQVNGISYKIGRKVGSGGYSSVYRVSDTQGRFYALKTIDTRNIKEDVLIVGFQREIALLKKLEKEPKVVQLIASEERDKIVYVVMELGDVDLEKIIRKGVDMELHTVKHISREIFKCVQAIHKHGIIHSDLKPANFISVKGTLKLIDFGLSDTPQGNTVSVYRSHAAGTLSYMAPEMFSECTVSKPNKYRVSGSSDVWGCGCIVYEMLYGRRVFEGQEDIFNAITDPNFKIAFPQQGKNFKVPQCFRNLVEECLVRDVSKRLTVDGALNGIALIDKYASVNDIHQLLVEAVDFGIQNVNFNNEDLKKFSDAKFSGLM